MLEWDILFEVEWSYNLWICKIQRNRARNTELVHTKIGICSDDSARREVYTLSHEVPTNSALLALESLTKRFERASRTLERLRLSWQLIVDVGSDVELE